MACRLDVLETAGWLEATARRATARLRGSSANLEERVAGAEGATGATAAAAADLTTGVETRLRGSSRAKRLVLEVTGWLTGTAGCTGRLTTEEEARLRGSSAKRLVRAAGVAGAGARAVRGV